MTIKKITTCSKNCTYQRVCFISVAMAIMLILIGIVGTKTAVADSVSDKTFFGTWKLEYVLGNGADGMNKTLSKGTRIYYIFTDDEMSGLSIAPDGSVSKLAKRSYSFSNGKLKDAAGANMDVLYQDGVLHLSEKGTEMLFIRADLDFLKNSTWNYVGLKDSKQANLEKQTQDFLSSGGSVTFTFREKDVVIATTQNGRTSTNTTSYTIQYDNVIQMNGSVVEILIAEDRMIITDGQTWQYYEKIADSGKSEKDSRQAPRGNSGTSDSGEKLNYKTVGSYVTFGTYPQTREGTDQTPIQWVVLDYDQTNDKVLLLSRYGLDAKRYNEGSGEITWEKCTLRTWLNGEFLNKAFSAQEQSAILTTIVDNSSRQGYGEWDTNGGNNTKDRFFLLSYAEVNKYLGVTYGDNNNIKSRVSPTDYAKAQSAAVNNGFQTADGNNTGFWYLRSPGRRQYYVSYVTDGGLLYDLDSRNSACSLRPAF